MRVIETWQDEGGHVFAIIRYTREERSDVGESLFGVMHRVRIIGHSIYGWRLTHISGPLKCGDSFFATLQEARDFLYNGLAWQVCAPNLWQYMVEPPWESTVKRFQDARRKKVGHKGDQESFFLGIVLTGPLVSVPAGRGESDYRLGMHIFGEGKTHQFVELVVPPDLFVQQRDVLQQGYWIYVQGTLDKAKSRLLAAGVWKDQKGGL